MSKARSTGNIGNIIKTSATCVTVNDGTTDLLIMSGSGTVTIPGNLIVLGGISGSSAESSSYSLSSSFATNANTLDGIDGASFLQTGSFNTFSSSIDTTIKNKLNGDGVISGSVQVDITNTTGYSTFSSSLSSSIGSLSGSVATTTSGLSSSIGSLSSSVATTTSGLASRIGSVETKTGSYATTGSNIFLGSQVITGSICSNGNIVTTGQIVAQTINVQQVTSSIVYSCGSNIFGNILSNTQQFTGSILATGSLTLTGPMIGSSTVCGVMANFSCVGIGTTSPAFSLNVYGTSPATVYQTANTGTGAANGFYVGHTGDVSYIWNYNNYPIVFATCNNEKMRIGSDGTKYFGTYNGSRIQVSASGENLYQYTNGYYIYGLFNDANSLSIESAFAGCIIFRTAAQTTSSSPTTATERMRIMHNGSVIMQSSLGICNGGAINMTIPNGNNGGAIRMVCCTGANEGDMFLTGGGGVGLLIAGSGNVGIGVTSPPEPLSVSFAAHGLISQHRQSCGVGVGQNFYMKFNNVVGTAVSYAGIYADVQSNTNGAHSGRMIIQVANAGSLTSAITIANSGVSSFASTICAPIVSRCGSKWQISGSIEGGNNACALVINIDNTRAVRVRGIITGIGGQTMTSLGMYEAVVYRLGGGAGNESKRFAVLVDCNASPGNSQGIKMDVIGDTLYIQNKTSMSYVQSITAWAELFYA